MFVMLAGLNSLGATAIGAPSAVDILFAMGQRMITDPSDRATFTSYGRSYIADFVSDFYSNGYTLVQDPGSLQIASGSQLLPIMQSRNSKYVFASLSPDQLSKMAAAIDSLPSSGYAFVAQSSLNVAPAQAPVTSPAQPQIPPPATATTLPPSDQTPQNVITVSSVPSSEKVQATPFTTLNAALKAVQAYAPLMPQRTQEQTAQLLMARQKRGQPVYVPKSTEWWPWIVGAGAIVLGGVALVILLKRKKG